MGTNEIVDDIIETFINSLKQEGIDSHLIIQLDASFNSDQKINLQKIEQIIYGNDTL
ncbi:TPA: hypothetical protein ACP9DH_002380 [Legionella anisa]